MGRLGQLAAIAGTVTLLGCGGAAPPRDPTDTYASTAPPPPPPPSAAFESPPMSAAGAPARSPSSLSGAGSAGAWKPFSGKVSERGSVMVLVDERQRKLRVPAEDFRENDDGSIEVRIGGHVRASTVQGEPLSSSTMKDNSCAQDHSSPKCSACIGFIRVCCDHGELVGACFGLSDCP